MAHIVSFINMKGGVGKTTLTVNIGYALAHQHKKKVLIVDCDPQFNTSTYLMRGKEYLKHISNKHTILNIFVPDWPGAISTLDGREIEKHPPTLDSCRFRVFRKASGHLDLIPSRLDLIEIDMLKRQAENRLKIFLDKITDAYDFILIDCPPTISIYTQAAVIASKKYIVPLKPDPLSTIGLPLLEKWLGEFTELAGLRIEPIGIVFCIVRSPLPNRMRQVMESLRNDRGDEVFDNYLTQSIRIAESVEANKPIFLFDKKAKWAEESLAITQEFLNRCEGE